MKKILLKKINFISGPPVGLLISFPASGEVEYIIATLHEDLKVGESIEGFISSVLICHDIDTAYKHFVGLKK